MDDDEFYTLVDEGVESLLIKIPQHGNTIFCMFPQYNFPRNLERRFMEEILSRINSHYSGKYKIYYKDFSVGFYLIDKEYEQQMKNTTKKQTSPYLERDFKEI